ncbi:MAG TPA: nucleotide sugar dehydrogenase [Candidatus Dormibacteraeota bacterium]|nr:nucleotide sugar dehydrogenase [Candidatus Dormibacteraeota bacterium]
MLEPLPDLTLHARTLARLESGAATVAVVGLGYVGLPLALALTGAGHMVIGIDRDPHRLADVGAGRSPIEDVGAAQLTAALAAGRLRVTDATAAIEAADAVVIAVPTPIDDHRVPDLEAVRQAAAAVAAAVRPGSLVVLESTTYPGTTEEVIVPTLRAHGLAPGIDVFVGYSPERIDPGNRVWQLSNTPKVVAGLTSACLELTVALYERIVERVVPVSSLRTAEITKLFENIFRVVNIALVNEFQQICDGFGIDVWEVLAACATKPYGFMPFYPGPGLGGHCVPVDPFYLAWKARELGIATEFIELAGKVNAQQPAYVVSSVTRLLNQRRKAVNGARVALLGVAYKKNVADVRESPAVRILELLDRAGAEVSYHDPHVPVFAFGGRALRSTPLSAEFVAAQDCVLVVTDHDAIDWGLVAAHAGAVVDTRDALRRPVVLPPAAEATGL